MRRWFVTLALTMIVSGCGKNERPPKPLEGPGSQESQPGQPRSATAPGGEARAMFQQVCATCHGADGKGDGPAAASLNPKPRNYTDPAWQASVTDDDLRKIIVDGGQAVGKSGMMPPNPMLKQRTDLLEDLVLLIREFGKQK